MTDHATRARAAGIMRAIVIAQQRIAGGYDDDPPNDPVALIAAALDQAAQEAVKEFEQEAAVVKDLWEMDHDRYIQERNECSELRKQLAQLQAAQPVWSKDKPKVAGWYWVRWPRLPQFGPEIREVTQPNGPDTDYLEVDDAPIDEYVADCESVEWAPCPLPREATCQKS